MTIYGGFDQFLAKNNSLVTIFGDYDQGTFSLWDKFDPWGTS
jgi:hypothetical protein